MMPDLGSYAAEVLAAYAVSLWVLGVLIAATVRRNRSVRAELEALETRRKVHNNG